MTTPTQAPAKVKKVVLAYSGGLDTSIILKWLMETYGCEVVTFTADLGQGEELAPARAKALAAGVKPENIFIDDVLCCSSHFSAETIYAELSSSAFHSSSKCSAHDSNSSTAGLFAGGAQRSDALIHTSRNTSPSSREVDVG